MRVLRAWGTFAAMLSLAVSGCGGGERQDAGEKDATYSVEIVEASFPTSQHVAEQATMKLRIRNAGEVEIPNVAVTVDGFAADSENAELADPSRPVWIVDNGPGGGDTAYVNTSALGRLAPGKEKTFEWKVTPVVPGTRTVKYVVAAGLTGKAKARLDGDKDPKGSFTVRISGEPADARVDPDTGAVQRRKP